MAAAEQVACKEGGAVGVQEFGRMKENAMQVTTHLPHSNQHTIRGALGYTVLIDWIAAHNRVSRVDEVEDALVLIPVHAIGTAHLHQH